MGVRMGTTNACSVESGLRHAGDEHSALIGLNSDGMVCAHCGQPIERTQIGTWSHVRGWLDGRCVATPRTDGLFVGTGQ
jgi:hypothetical protein